MYDSTLNKVNGGKIPITKSHLVIDKPESVNLVRPPTIIINPTRKVINKSHMITCLFLFSSIIKLIYISLKK